MELALDVLLNFAVSILYALAAGLQNLLMVCLVMSKVF